MLGNVACGDDRQTQVVIDSDALPCLRALLASSDRGIRKEVCWIVSNITESSHQVQDVLDADILPPLLHLLDNQDTACREDATWVLFNLSSNRDPQQVAYLAEQDGVRALCNLLACEKDLDVLWKGCGTVAAVALKGLRNILISGHAAASSDPSTYNKMASLVAEAHGVERIESLTNHTSLDVRTRARLILERVFGAEPTTTDSSSPMSSSNGALAALSTPPPPPSVVHSHASCSCAFGHHHPHPHVTSHYQSNGLYDISGNLTSHAALSAPHFSHALGMEHSMQSHLHADADLMDVPGSSSGSSTDSDPEDDDSDSELIPPAPPTCTCVLCTDSNTLTDRRARGKGSDNPDSFKYDSSGVNCRPICDFCSGGGRLGDGRAGLAAKLGRAVRLGHPHCLAVLLSRMSWSQRAAATDAPALLHPGGGPPDGGIGNSLPAVVLAAQMGKPECLALLLRKCRPDLNHTFGKKRLTALGWAAHKGYLRCCQLLIEYGANPATKCGDGVTALHLAASGGGSVSVCKLLIENNAPVNARSSKKQTPLCLAAQKGFSQVVQLLLEHGAEPNNEDEGKYTPLHLASSKGYEHCVDLLLKAGAEVDATTRKGVTPLHYAVQVGHAAVVRLLIAAGAKVNCNRKPLLLIAADDGNAEVVRILLDANAAVDCKANIKAMLDKETEVSDGLTPLQLAASKAHPEVVELLLSRGANVNEVSSKSGWSALDFAVLNGHADCAVTLLEHGATVTDNCKSIGRNNWTLVQHAANHGAKDVVRLLVQRLQEQRMGSSSFPDNGSKALGPGIDNSNTASIHTCHDSESMNGISRDPVDYDDCTGHAEYVHESGQCIHALHSGCPHHHIDFDTCNQSVHRYDPRSLDGDEAGFGTGGPGYSNSATVSEMTSKSRRRVPRDDRHAGLRAREMRKREFEASEARDRLEEAINQRSVTKLTEAIAHVSKLVLHLATNVGAEANGLNDQIDNGDANGFHEPHNCPSSSSVPCHSKAPPLFNGIGDVTAPLAMEVGLGNEVQKARRILAGLQAEEKRLREEKEKEAADSKRENAHIAIKKAMSTALQGGDPRSLSRAVTRLTRSILSKDDEVIQEARTISGMIADLDKSSSAMKAAMNNRKLDELLDKLPKVKQYLSQLVEKGGEGAAERVFGGAAPLKTITSAEALLDELKEKQERAMEEEAHAKNKEENARLKLEEAMTSNDILALEKALADANDALLGKDSDLRSTIESGKKVLTKWVKAERKKLRHAGNSNDPEVIEKAAESAAKLGLQSLQADIDGAKVQARKLREQAEATRDLRLAIESGEIQDLKSIREKLTSLGMFSEADEARAEVERLHKARRARTLLEDAIDDMKKCIGPVSEAFDASNSPSEISELLLSWTWPDVQRLCDFTKRAEKYGQSSQKLCETASELSSSIAVLGRKVLEICLESDDAQFIASMLSGYEKSLGSVTRGGLIGKHGGDKAVSDAKKRLAEVQAMDQASVKAESAQVKVEYALATSRRTSARTRHSKGNGNNVGGQRTVLSGVSASSPQGNSSTGPGSAEGPSQSSASSDYGEDDISETEGSVSGLLSQSTVVSRGTNATDRSNVAKKSRGMTYVSDDLGVPDASAENVSAVPGECSHFYKFKEGTTVYCIRCGHLRTSVNPEWLARVKRRGARLPPEYETSSSTGQTSPVVDVGGVSRIRDVNHGRNMNDMLSADQRAAGRFRRGEGMGGMNNHGQGMVSAGFMIPMVTMGRDGRPVNTLVPAAGHEGVVHQGGMPMVMPLMGPQHNSIGQRQAVTKSPVTAHRGRGRPHLSMGGESNNAHAVAAAVAAVGMDGHMVGLNAGMYGSSSGGGPRGVPGTAGINIIGSAGMGMVGSAAAAAAIAAAGGGFGPLRGPGLSPTGQGVVSNVSATVGYPMAPMGTFNASDGRMSGLDCLPSDDVNAGGMDLGLDFANENFGFDIDAIVDDNPLPSSRVTGSSGMDGQDRDRGGLMCDSSANGGGMTDNRPASDGSVGRVPDNSSVSSSRGNAPSRRQRSYGR